jgi:hypothetical protein
MLRDDARDALDAVEICANTMNSVELELGVAPRSTGAQARVGNVAQAPGHVLLATRRGKTVEHTSACL